MEGGHVFATSVGVYMEEPKMARKRYWRGLLVGSYMMVWGGLEYWADGGQSVYVSYLDSQVLYRWP